MRDRVLCQLRIALTSCCQPQGSTIAAMPSLPLQFLLLTLAGWMIRDQHRITDYLLAENAVLREQLRSRRIRYTDAQRRRLAAAAKKLGARLLRSSTRS